MLDDRVLHIFGTELWDRMNEKERRRVRHHLQASTISQFMHGEQSALIATAKIVQTVPELDIQPHRPDCEGHRSLGAQVQEAFAAMGAIEFAAVDAGALFGRGRPCRRRLRCPNAAAQRKRAIARLNMCLAALSALRQPFNALAR